MRKLRLTFTPLLLAALVITMIFTPAVKAADAANWKAGEIIDDVLFTNKNSMSVGQIQDFLNAKVGTGAYGAHPGQCDTYGTAPSELGDGTRAQYGADHGNNAPFTCLKDYYEVPKTSPGPGIPANNYGGKPIPAGAESAAQLIWDAAQRYNINPQVLLVTIQKESVGPLTTDDWPFLSQYTYAMGAHCPDSGPGGSANCDPNYAGFSIQISESAALFRYYLDNMNQSWWPYKKVGVNSILYNPNSACGSSNVNITTMATAALYTYTPYQPNAAALANLYGTGDSCSAYGNRNFWRIFYDWFGPPYDYVYNGLIYKDVFDPTYYANNNPDVANAVGTDPIALFNHFVQYGMSEGRQASANFNVTSYLDRYPDLRNVFHWNLPAYYAHYEQWGKAQGRIATGNYLGGTTVINGIDYSAVYNFDYYEKNNSDVASAFGVDDVAALQHFVQHGMKEGRQASADFNVYDYMNKYPDLRWSTGFGWNLPAYYIHYVQHGKAEGRVANVSGPVQYLTTLNGIDYSPVYDFASYQANNSDIKNAFGGNDFATLQHFVQYGMSEGRLASANFNVYDYKNRYPDLRAAFGNNLKAYYIHYIQYGKAEGRNGA